MRLRRLRAPSPAMVVACLALFLGLSGTVYAGVKIAKNSVGSSEIRNKSVKGGDLVDDTVTGEQIDESTLGVVPRAAAAGTASAASSAATAGTAKSADRASTAGVADRATTADRATYADRAGVATTATTADKATTADRATTAASADRAATATTADRATTAASADRAATATTATTADKASEATHAGNADTVGGRTASDFASSSAVFPVAAKLAGGETRTLVARDGVRLDARCTANEPNVGATTPSTLTVLRIYAYTTAAGATLQAPWSGSTFDGSSDTAFLGPTSGTNGLALKLASGTGTNGEQLRSTGIVLTSPGGTSIFFGTTGGIRVAFGLNGAVCMVAAPVLVAAP